MRFSTVLLTTLFVSTQKIAALRVSRNATQVATSSIEARLASAEPFLTRNLASKVLNGMIVANWVDDGEEFWYQKQHNAGFRFTLVESATGVERDAFDHQAVAAALTDATGEIIHPDFLPVAGFSAADKDGGLTVATYMGLCTCEGTPLSCELHATDLWEGPQIISPAGDKAVFVKDNNLWLRDLASGVAQQLSIGGSDAFRFGNIGSFDTQQVNRRRAGVGKAPEGLMWSPDGRYLLSARVDHTKIPMRLSVVEYVPPDSGYPIINTDRYQVAGDRLQSPIEVTLFDLQENRIIPVNVGASQLRDWALLWLDHLSVWTENEVYIITAEGVGETYGIGKISLSNGSFRQIVTETQEPFYSFNQFDLGQPNFRLLLESNEIIWYSSRSGFGQLYLYDCNTGEEIRTLTSGPGEVFDIIHVDETERVVFFSAGGRENGRNPNYRHLYKVSLDGGSPQLLTPEDADHEFIGLFGISGLADGLVPGQGTVSPNGKYIIDSYSTIKDPPITIVRDNTGAKLYTLVEADATALYATGWTPPESFVVKAADDITEVYGFFYKPTNFDPNFKYPVIEKVYGGPQAPWTSHNFMGSFVALQHVGGYDLPAMAELGFIAINIEGRGAPRRGLEFRHAFSRDEDVLGSIDHRVAIEQLAERYEYIDASRVGITGESFGGYFSARAMLLHPDFFDVAVSKVGPHDFRSVHEEANIRYFGVPAAPDTDNDFFNTINNANLADRLEGNLLLIYGTLDENVRLNQGILFMDALIKANKDFDTLIVPGGTHSLYEAEDYVRRRTMTYFVENLGNPVPRSGSMGHASLIGSLCALLPISFALWFLA